MGSVSLIREGIMNLYESWAKDWRSNRPRPGFIGGDGVVFEAKPFWCPDGGCAFDDHRVVGVKLTLGNAALGPEREQD